MWSKCIPDNYHCNFAHKGCANIKLCVCVCVYTHICVYFLTTVEIVKMCSSFSLIDKFNAEI